MALLTFDRVHFAYREHPVLKGVSFEGGDGELLVVLGPSGSGKSTVLRLAAGLEAPRSGTISLNRRPASVDGRVLIEPAARNVSLVFQDLALWPHMTSDEQLHFVGPELDAESRKALLKDVGLEDFLSRLPARMSGGERQRLALARALAAKPQILLLDEPFANLDPLLRLDLRHLLLELHRAHPVSIVYVTHDLEDAFGLADRIAVLNEGRLEQAASPEELYRHPQSAFVATFVGKAAIVPATLEGAEIRTPFGVFANPRSDIVGAPRIDVVLRPEDVEVAPDGAPARVAEVLFVGKQYLALLSTTWGRIWIYTSTRPVPGDSLTIRARHGWPVEPSR